MKKIKLANSVNLCKDPEMSYCVTCDTCTPTLPIEPDQECCVCGNLKLVAAVIKEIPVKSISDVKDFLHYVIFDLNLNFHPDTPFRLYINECGEPIFTKDQCHRLNKMLYAAFHICQHAKADIYQLCIEVEEREEHVQALLACRKEIEAAMYCLASAGNTKISESTCTYDIAGNFAKLLNKLDSIQSLQKS